MKPESGEEILRRLIDFATELNYEDLPENVVHETKRRIIDAYGCSYGSAADPKFRRLGALLDHPPLDRVAFLNTAAIRWLDWNDTYLAKEPAHPSDNLGLLMAVIGPFASVSGKDFLTAAVIAYDIQCRLCEAASLRKNGWDHVNYLLISATLAGARLMGLNKDQMYAAAALALNQGIALRQVRAGKSLSEWKGCSSAGAARTAAFALELVKLSEFSGPSEIMDGEFGFVKQVCGPLDPKAFEDLGKKFLIAETYLKKYPVEYHAQTTVAHALALYEQLGGAADPEAIDSIRIVTYEAARAIIGDSAKRRPLTKESADHSLYYILAVGLLEGELTLEQYRPELFADPRVLALIDKMRLEESHDFTVSYASPPEKRDFPSCVEVRLKSGKVLSDFQHLPRGHPKNPMTDEELNEKVLALAGGQKDEAVEALDDFWHLEELADMKDYIL